MSLPVVLNRVFDTVCEFLGLLTDVAKWYFKIILYAIASSAVLTLIILLCLKADASFGWNLGIIEGALAVILVIGWGILVFIPMTMAEKLGKDSAIVGRLEGLAILAAGGLLVTLAASSGRIPPDFKIVAFSMYGMLGVVTLFTFRHTSGRMALLKRALPWGISGILVAVVGFSYLPSSVQAMLGRTPRLIERTAGTPSRIDYYVDEIDRVVENSTKSEITPFNEYGEPQLACVMRDDGKYPDCFRQIAGRPTFNPSTGLEVPPISIQSWPVIYANMKQARDTLLAQAQAEVEATAKKAAEEAAAAEAKRIEDQRIARAITESRPAERPGPIPVVPPPPPVVEPEPVPPPPEPPPPQVIFLKTVVTSQIPDPNDKNTSIIVAQVQDPVNLPFLTLRSGEDLIRYQVIGLSETGEDEYSVTLNPIDYISGNRTELLPADHLTWIRPNILAKRGNGRRWWQNPLVQTAIGAGAGAVGGAIIDGKEGAVKGAIAVGGATAVTVLIVGKHQGKEFNVPGGTPIPLRLTVKQ